MAQAINNWQMDQKADLNAPKEQVKYISTFKALSGYMRAHRLTFAGFILCTLIAITAELLQPYLVKIAIDDNLLAGRGDYRGLLIICGIYMGLSAASFLFSYLQHNLLQQAGQSIVASIRQRLFEHIARLPMSYFDRVPSGSLITHVSSDTEAINQFFNQVVLSLFRDGLTLLFILALMFELDPQLTLYCLILVPLIAAIAIAFRSFMRNTYQMARTRLSRLVSFVAENLSGMHLIQVFHQQEEQRRQFRERNDSYFRANVREIRTNVVFNRTFEILNNIAIAVIVWLGGRAVLGAELEFGVLYAFITYIRMFFQPINTITQQWNTLQSATVAISRVWSIFAIRPEIDDKPQAQSVEPQSVQGRIDFDGVAFGYGDGKPVIEGLDLHIRPGERIGIVGATGAGKSSLISLLCRFYDVREGSIRIDGRDVRDMRQQELHRIVGLVQQEPYLYAGTVLDNVRMFDPAVSREEAIRACRFVGADAIIERMEAGYDTRLSERGSGLSAGERQLISFARILVFQPKILILDEATANLDSHTEQLIQHALQLVSVGRTTLVIAHRLSTIMGADRILVMSRGQIVEQGAHQELLDADGHYAELHRHAQGRQRAQHGAGAAIG
ncbi:ABC transporter [Paenibacillus sp. 598K]|uniref:ABC transporter ATP-binding protein n=1 Tax=Paenibacillus sp. 598K TaxID=1117987 RepID=UPI000FF9728A|nr:ABC transporter ATP-binding protein [Paenibacillus sp. 598K]GBF72934.1 ABC transporter [Paenibacillus sp. 598K]